MKRSFHKIKYAAKGSEKVSKFKLSNDIFNLGLSAKEMAVYAYMSSLPSDIKTISGNTVKVKQSTIALKCGISARQTVAKIIRSLTAKKLILPLERSIKADKHKGTYLYDVKQLPVNKNYFFVDRHIFNNVTPYQMIIYLFICKSYNNILQDSWNSFKNISEQTGMKREMIIKIISELEEMQLIRRSRRKAMNNRRLYIKNHYFIVFFQKGKIKKKCEKIARMHCNCTRTKSLVKNENFYIYNDNTIIANCQEKNQKIFDFYSNRGSP